MRRERYNARSCAIRASVGLALVSWITLAPASCVASLSTTRHKSGKARLSREWLRDWDVCRKAVIMEQNRLEVTPSELRFRFELKRAIAATMTLTNKGGAPTAFKVKTTAPKKYCVRPSSGIVEAGRTMVVNVTMQSQRAMPDDSEFENCRDKFLVQSVTCDPGLDSLTPELFDKTKNPTGIQEHRMRVRLERPTTSVGDMAEKGEGNAANGLTEANSSPASATAAVVAQMPQEASVEQMNELIAERNKLKQELQEIADEKANLVQQVRELKLGDHGPDGSSMGKPADPGTTAAPQLNIVVVLLVSIIAFIAGHWLSQ